MKWTENNVYYLHQKKQEREFYVLQIDKTKRNKKTS